jgi:hypothetical protein
LSLLPRGEEPVVFLVLLLLFLRLSETAFRAFPLVQCMCIGTSRGPDRANLTREGCASQAKLSHPRQPLQ